MFSELMLTVLNEQPVEVYLRIEMWLYLISKNMAR